MTYWAGIDTAEEAVKFLPFTECELSLYGVKIRRKSYRFEQRIANGEKGTYSGGNLIFTYIVTS